MYALTLMMLVCLQAPAADKPAPGAAKEVVFDQAVLDKQFQETLNGATLVGSFTADDAPQGQLREDRYRIDKVTKLKNDYWLFESTVEYDGKNIPIRIPLQVKWAGDTAVITLTDVLFPGLGSFTARVLVYRGQYAGTWQGQTHGGHMFGRIERPESEAPKDEKEAKPETKPEA